MVARLMTAMLMLICTACGASEVGTPPATSTHSLHAADSGTTISVHVGETVTVTLTDVADVPGSHTLWTAGASGPVLKLVSTSPTNLFATSAIFGEKDVTTTFTVVAAGSEDIVATAAQACEAMNPAFCKGPAPLTFHVVATT